MPKKKISVKCDNNRELWLSEELEILEYASIFFMEEVWENNPACAAGEDGQYFWYRNCGGELCHNLFAPEPWQSIRNAIDLYARSHGESLESVPTRVEAEQETEPSVEQEIELWIEQQMEPPAG
ncbi:hypothetical protein MMC10_007617 [Thelotrema lepadinum]|nr:hypothetical protein [Thelotrema lepadinum]